MDVLHCKSPDLVCDMTGKDCEGIYDDSAADRGISRVFYLLADWAETQIFDALARGMNTNGDLDKSGSSTRIGRNRVESLAKLSNSRFWSFHAWHHSGIL